MPRKRSSAVSALIREQRRRRLLAKNEVLHANKYCPRCKKKSIEMQEDGSAYVDDPRRVGYLIKIKVGKVFCTICGERRRMGIPPGEGLIDIYNLMFDEMVLQLRMEAGLPFLFDYPYWGDKPYHEIAKAKERYRNSIEYRSFKAMRWLFDV